jgi:hypothetical protein
MIEWIYLSGVIVFVLLNLSRKITFNKLLSILMTSLFSWLSVGLYLYVKNF